MQLEQGVLVQLLHRRCGVAGHRRRVSRGAPGPARSRWCRPRRPACRRGSAGPSRTAGRRRRGTGVERWSPSKATSTTCSGRTSTTHPEVPSTASSVKRSVCQRSISSVMPLNVLPIMTKPPVSGSRAPRWMFDRVPWRRPDPHSTASTTRSRVCVGLTLTQPLPRRPAAYGLPAALTTTPSWPAATSSAKKRSASPASDVRTRGTRRCGARSTSDLVTGQGGLVDEVDPVAVEDVEQERRERQPLAQPRDVGGAGGA